MLRVVASEDVRQEFALTLDEICRRGAERMLAIALEAEVDAYVERHREARDERGRALVVRNGHARPRTVVAGAGALEVAAPRVDDGQVDPATGERSRFRSSILPPYARRSPKVAEVLPLLYLHGLSTKDFVPALAEFFGTSSGLSAAAITRLTSSWSAEREAFMARDLSGVDYVYCWVDGVHFTVRLGDDDRLCVLVMVGVRTDGRKELIAIADGYRESTESWAELLRHARRKGMRAPVLAVGDGALGFWAAVRDVFPETRWQRDWVHKVANVLNALPASVQAAARRALREIHAVVCYTYSHGEAVPRAVGVDSRRVSGGGWARLRVPRHASRGWIDGLGTQTVTRFRAHRSIRARGRGRPPAQLRSNPSRCGLRARSRGAILCHPSGSPRSARADSLTGLRCGTAPGDSPGAVPL
jgi:transposase-like protein